MFYIIYLNKGLLGTMVKTMLGGPGKAPKKFFWNNVKHKKNDHGCKKCQCFNKKIKSHILELMEVEMISLTI